MAGPESSNTTQYTAKARQLNTCIYMYVCLCMCTCMFVHVYMCTFVCVHAVCSDILDLSPGLSRMPQLPEPSSNWMAQTYTLDVAH